MCGIIGYSGFQPAIPLILEALKKLEYRGYDSSGIAFIRNNSFVTIKAPGKLSALEEKLSCEYNALSTTGIGHTRWATHGEPSIENAHPHCDNKQKITLVHNGIIENYLELKEFLAPYHISYCSETDTEVLVNFIAWHKEKEGSMEKALQAALPKVKGAYALVLSDLDEPDRLWAIRQAGPLLFGVGQGEYFVASDAPAFLAWTKNVIFLKEGELLTFNPDGYELKSLKTLESIHRDPVTLQWDLLSAQKGGYKHFMLKEIFEQPKVIKDCLRGRIHNNSIDIPELSTITKPSRLLILACGTSYYAGLWAKEVIEAIAGIGVQVELASEMAFRNVAFMEGDLALCISQSGETADTLAALKKCKENKVPVIALCNVLGSSLAREADKVIYTQAGPEISVASTKAMTSQLVMLLLLALYWAKNKSEINELYNVLNTIPNILEKELPILEKKAQEFAEIFYEYQHFFFLGRGLQYPLAMEGALKLKELSYIHAEGYASGEMKHGPVALIDSMFPSFILAIDDCLFQKIRSNAEVVQARKGPTLVLTNPNTSINCDYKWEIPFLSQPFSTFLVLPALQLFAYQMAAKRGHDVDQPRNLAKSVTVE